MSSNNVNNDGVKTPNFDFSGSAEPVKGNTSGNVHNVNSLNFTGNNFSYDTAMQPAGPVLVDGPGTVHPVESQSGSSSGYKGIHPIAAAFHVAFKIGALLTFILGGLFSSRYVVIFVITVLFIAADFWTTKNVTGRILVSLRWWNEVKEDGSTQWIFESSPEAEQRVNAYDRWFFWLTLGGYSALWLLMCVFNIMSISKLPIALVGLALSGANLLGYIKCQRDAKSRITQFVISHAGPAVARQAANSAVEAR